MKLHRRSSKSWKTLLQQIIKMELILIALTVLGGCAALFTADPPPPPEPKVIVETKYVEKKIPIQPRPKGLKMRDVSWYVVTPANIDSFHAKIKSNLGEDWVYYGIEVPDYENLALNVGDIQRYILQQQALLDYYEGAAKGEHDNMTVTLDLDKKGE